MTKDIRYITQKVVEPCYCNKLRKKKNCYHPVKHIHDNINYCSLCDIEVEIWGLDF